MTTEHHDPRKQEYAQDQRGQYVRGMFTPWERRDGIAAENPEAYRQQQGNELRDGLPLRAGATMPGTYYLSHDHPQLKKMVTDNVDINDAHDIGREWNKLGNVLVDFHTDLRNAVNSSADGWQGAAADATRQHISDMADVVGTNARACQYAGNCVAQQADAVARARNMPEPVNVSMLDAMKMVATEPNPFKMPQVIGQIQQKFDQKQQAHAEAAQMMTTMETSMGQAISTMPAFVAEPPPGNQPPPEKKQQPVNDPGRGGRPGVPGTGGNAPSGTFSMPSYTGTGQPAPAPMPPMPPPSGVQPPHAPPQPAPVWHPGDQTYGQGAGSDAGGRRGGSPYPSYPGSGSLSDRPGAGSPGSGGVAPVGPIGPGGRGGGSEGYGGRGRGGAVGGLGGVGEGAAGGGRGGLGAGRGPGGTLGVGGAPAEGGVVGRGGAGVGGAGGRAGTPGAMMAGGAGGAGGKGEDGEHQRPSYLEEADPESIFGTDQKVAPPVIGE